MVGHIVPLREVMAAVKWSEVPLETTPFRYLEPVFQSIG